MITYTTAPRDYDWGCTRELVAVMGTDKRGRAVRKVVTRGGLGAEQRMRYASGLHMAADESEWRKLVGYGLVTADQARETKNT